MPFVTAGAPSSSFTMFTEAYYRGVISLLLKITPSRIIQAVIEGTVVGILTTRVLKNASGRRLSPCKEVEKRWNSRHLVIFGRVTWRLSKHWGGHNRTAVIGHLMQTTWGNTPVSSIMPWMLTERKTFWKNIREKRKTRAPEFLISGLFTN